MEQKECSVRIERIVREGDQLLVSGTVRKQPEQRIEVMTNGDVFRRCVLPTDIEEGEWKCCVGVPSSESVEIEASIREYDDFNALFQPVPSDSYFELDGRVVWGASVTEGPDGLYYMIFSNWKETQGFGADWAVYSELGYAVSGSPAGPFVYQGKALDASYANTTNEQPVVWKGVGRLEVFHNPTLLHSERDGMYYLYFMGTNASAGGYRYEYSRNHQRIGVAYAETPAGPWTVLDNPLIDVRENMFDSLLTSNPSVTEVKHSDGRYTYHIVYKGVSRHIEHGKIRDVVVSGYGESDGPLGPFIRSSEAIMRNPEQDFSVEDCYLWYRDDIFYALAKDMHNYFTSAQEVIHSYALFSMDENMAWKPSEHYPLAYVPVIPWKQGAQKVTNLERAQLYINNGIPIMMCAATTKNGKSPYEGHSPINVQIPLLGRRLAHDSKTLVINGRLNTVSESFDLVEEKERIVNWNGLGEEDKISARSLLRALRILVARPDISAADYKFYDALLERLIKLSGMMTEGEKKK